MTNQTPVFKERVYQRFNTICSLPASMQIQEFKPYMKDYEESIVDKSCFTPLTEQLKGLQPMTPQEREQHFDFIDGKDTGLSMPLRKGADISEIAQDIRNKQSKIKQKLDKAAEQMVLEAKTKALAESVFSEKQSINNK